MIEFKQLDPKEDGPRDVEVRTDDANAELALMTESFNDQGASEFVAAQNLKVATADDEGFYTFVIPGEEVGEVGELFWSDDDLGQSFEDFTDECNRRAIEALNDGEAGE